MNSQRAPGAILLHPIAVVSLCVLVLNDHVLKSCCPGVITGKLSDLAGVLLLPLLLQAGFEVATTRVRGRAPGDVTHRRVLVGVCALSAVAFALPELSATAEAVTCVAFGVARWPLEALAALLGGAPLPPVHPVGATADTTDLVALPLVLVAYHLARRPHPGDARQNGLMRAGAGAAVLASALLLCPRAHAGEPPAEPARPERPARHGRHTHDGFYLSAELGAGAASITSARSISNGYRQPLRSSARGFTVPAVGFALGGTPRRTGLVIGGRFFFASMYQPVISTVGERFILEEMELDMTSTELFLSFYPDPRRGLHAGAGFGFVTLERLYGLGGNIQEGAGVSFDLGHDFWVSGQLSLGLTARVAVARVGGDPDARSNLLTSALVGSLTWH